MNKSASIALSVMFVIIIAGGWYIFTTPRAAAPTPVVAPAIQQTNVIPSAKAPASNAPMSATVNMTKNGFSPDPVTIKQGGTVTFVSTDGSPMWVASNAHPTHLQYSGTSRTQHCPDTTGTAFDQCVSGKAYSFTFMKVGQWNYHNHMNADDGGTIIVE